MADNMSSEGKRMSVVYYCVDCHHEYREITFDKKEYKEELVCPRCKGKAVDKWKIAKYIGGVDFSSKGDYSVETTFDINGTIKGLKAIQCEAKKATAALKELSETTPETLAGLAVSKSIQVANGYKPHTVVFDEMHSMCPRCGSTNRNREDLTNGNEKVYAVRITCSDCRYTL